MLKVIIIIIFNKFPTTYHVTFNAWTPGPILVKRIVKIDYLV